MSDVRQPDDLVAAVVALEAKLADLESTLMVRATRRPTGDIEPTIRKTPKPNTLFMQGQIVLRSDYPVLYQFAVDNNLFAVGLFGPADGVTTFGLPNFTGRTIIGGNDAEDFPLGWEYGQDLRLITIDQLPSHSHNTAEAAGFADDAGDHGGHINSVFTGVAVPGGGGSTVPAGSGGGNGQHWHNIVQGHVGGNQVFDVRQASKIVNWMIYI